MNYKHEYHKLLSIVAGVKDGAKKVETSKSSEMEYYKKGIEDAIDSIYECMKKYK